MTNQMDRPRRTNPAAPWRSSKEPRLPSSDAQALAAYACQARQDPQVAEIVRLMLASRRERRNGRSNVIELPGGRNG